MDGREKKIILLTSTVHGLVHMQMLVFAAVNIMMANDLQTSITAIGFVGTIGYFLFGFGALPAGFVIDAVGARRVIAICLSGMALADLMLAFSPNAFWAMAGLALAGLSGSLYHPAGLGLISRNVSKTGHALGIHGTFGGVGLALGPFVAGIVASQFGWRWAYLWISVPMLLMAATYFTVRFGDVGEDHKHLAPEPEKKFGDGMLQLMLIVILLQMMSGFIYRASITFLPKYTGDAMANIFQGMDATARGGLLTGVIFIAGAVGQYISGLLTKKHRTEKLQLIMSLLVAPLLFATGLLSGYPLLASAMAFSFVFFAIQPLGNALVARYSPAGIRGRSYGVSFFLSFGVGSFGSGFAGFVGEHQGFNAIYLWLGGVGCISIILALLIFTLANHRRKTATPDQAVVTASVNSD